MAPPFKRKLLLTPAAPLTAPTTPTMPRKITFVYASDAGPTHAAAHDRGNADLARRECGKAGRGYLARRLSTPRCGSLPSGEVPKQPKAPETHHRAPVERGEAI